jgi:D-alanyl-D-alanine carboxypeptidase
MQAFDPIVEHHVSQRRSISFDTRGLSYIAGTLVAGVFTLSFATPGGLSSPPIAIPTPDATTAKNALASVQNMASVLVALVQVPENVEASPSQTTPPPQKDTQAISRTLASRTVAGHTVRDYIPDEGAFIAIDLSQMKVILYEDGAPTESFDVLSKGRKGSHWETPTGLYDVLTKEENHFSSIGQVNMPYSMQFFGNFFIHGWPTYADGTSVSEGYSGGCVRLSTEDAARVFDYATVGTPIFIFEESDMPNTRTVEIQDITLPPISAQAFVVGDLSSGRIFAERRAGSKYSIASITKIMTALVANETISFDKEITIPEGGDFTVRDYGSVKEGDTYYVEDMLYPLLMESSNVVAHALADYYGKTNFIRWMDSKADALGMAHTSFADTSGISAYNTSTAEDLFMLARYVYDRASFILGISSEPEDKKILTREGDLRAFANRNVFMEEEEFVGGKIGYTTEALETMLSVFEIPVGDTIVPVAIIVLRSSSRERDVRALLEWFKQTAAVE